VIVTARDHAQTIELLDLAGLGGTYSVIGRHYGKGRVDKLRGLFVRAKQLVSYIHEPKKISVAVSHGSRSMVLAARWLKVPVLTMYDYEFTETRIFNTFSTKVLVPEKIEDAALDAIGLAREKRVKYPGIKEEIYVSRFEPQPGFRDELLARHGYAANPSTVLVTLRPPATTANYHSERSEVLLDDLLHFLLSAGNVLTVVVPRTREQAAAISRSIENIPDSRSRCIILAHTVDGLQLAYASDLLISGGGTMNREASLLGVPVYSIFAGRQGSLDRQMEADGTITFIRDARDLSKVRLERRDRHVIKPLTGRVGKFLIAEIEKFL